MSKVNEGSKQRANNVSRWSRKIIGRTNFLAVLLSLATLHATANTGSVVLAWKASGSTTSKTAIGYDLFYGQVNGVYTSSINTGTNLTATVTGLTPGLTYYFGVSAYNTNGSMSAITNIVTNRIPIVPSITGQPLTQTTVAGTPAALSVNATGDAPLSYQWMNAHSRVAGATNSILSWPSIGSGNAGSFTVIVSNPWGSATSSVTVLTVLIPPSITKQPQSLTVIAAQGASFSSAAAGTAPLSIQWYHGTMALAGATNSSLALTSVSATNAGIYFFTVSNAAGKLSSSAAVLTVLPSNMFASVAGTYNGLFFQTNTDGTPAVTEATAGFLGNCVVAANGAFSAKLYVGGQSYSWSGNFNISGNHGASIPHSELSAFLQLDLTNGTQQLTGSVSSTASSNVWTSPLVAVLATNAYPQLTNATLALNAGTSANAPTNNGAASGVFSKGVLSLSGTLGDTTAFSQTVPISKNGDAPVYVSLYNNTGLLEGWIDVSGGLVTGNLTWIRPGGIIVPVGFPQGFNTMVKVTGTTLNN